MLAALSNYFITTKMSKNRVLKARKSEVAKQVRK